MAKSKRQSRSKKKTKTVPSKIDRINVKKSTLETDKTAEVCAENKSQKSDDSETCSAERNGICVDLVPCSVCLDRQEGNIDGKKSSRFFRNGVVGDKSSVNSLSSSSSFSSSSLAKVDHSERRSSSSDESFAEVALLEESDNAETVSCKTSNIFNDTEEFNKIDISDKTKFEKEAVACEQMFNDKAGKCSHVAVDSTGGNKRQTSRLVRSAVRILKNCCKESVIRTTDVKPAEIIEAEFINDHKTLKDLTQETDYEKVSTDCKSSFKKLIQSDNKIVEPKASSDNFGIIVAKSELPIASSSLTASTDLFSFELTDVLPNLPSEKENSDQLLTVRDLFESDDNKMDEIFGNKTFAANTVSSLDEKGTPEDQNQLFQAKLQQEQSESDIKESASLGFSKSKMKKSQKFGRKLLKKKSSKSVLSNARKVNTLLFSTECSNFAATPTKIKTKPGKRENRSISSKEKSMDCCSISSVTVKNSPSALVLTRTSNGLIMPEDGSTSRKRHLEVRDPWQNLHLEQHACLLWSSKARLPDLLNDKEPNVSQYATDYSQPVRAASSIKSSPEIVVQSINPAVGLSKHGKLGRTNTMFEQQLNEQRRRFQLEHPEAKSEELDEIMRNYWKKMSQKECQRYVQRARNAMNDRNGMQRTRFHNFSRSSVTDGHLKGMGLNDQECRDDRLQDSLKNHFACSEHLVEQMSRCINARLKYLQKNLTLPQYQKFIEEFYRRLMESEKSSIQNGKFRDNAEEQPKYFENTLKIMQTLIQDQEKNLTYCRCEQRAVKRRRFMERYDRLIEQVLQGSENISFGDVKSEVLTELLADLEDLEVTGSDFNMEENAKIDALANTLSLGMHAFIGIDAQEDALPNIEDSFYQKLLLYEMSCQSNLFLLPVEDIDKCLNESCTYPEIVSLHEEQLLAVLPSDVFLMDAFSRILRQMAGVEACCELNSPSCILSDLLIASKLQQFENAAQWNTESMVSVRHNEEPLTKGMNMLQTMSKHASGTADFLSNISRPSTSFTEVMHSGMESSQSEYCLLPDPDLDGIFGVDTWLTNPIVDQFPIHQEISTSSLEDISISCTEHMCQMVTNSFSLQNRNPCLQNLQAHPSSYLGPWTFQEQGDDLSFLNILQDGTAVESEAVDSDC